MKAKFLEPETIHEASALLAEFGEEAKVIAGGTAVVLMLQQKLIAPTVLVSLRQISGYSGFRLADGGLHIGALARLRDAEQSPDLRKFYPALAHAFAVVGNVRVRNQATVGGNLAEADYASDPPTMLLALNASVRATNSERQREIPLQDFFLGFYTTALEPEEILTEVFVPGLPDTARATYLKYTSRSAEDRPCVGVATVADFDAEGRCQDLRVAVGAAVETPQRLHDVEVMARGEVLTEELIRTIAKEYAQSLDPLEDLRGSVWYRREMVRVFVRRALEEVQIGYR